MKVSIIIPVYQISAYIERCICSVMAQNYTDIECIVVDDATMDDSIKKCEQLISAYHGPVQFSIIHHKQNKGLSVARNTGTEVASGEYVFYLDGDDEITPDCIEKLVAPILRDESIEMVMGGVARYDTSNPIPKETKAQYYPTNSAVRDYFFSKKGFYVGAWNKLINRFFLVRNQLFFTERLLYEDQLWTFLVVKHLSHLYRISDVTYMYYVRPNSIITGTDKEELTLNWARVYKSIADNFTLEESGREAKHYARGLCVRYTEHSGCSELHEVAGRYLKELTGIRFLPEFMLLKSTIVFSKYSIGRVMLQMIANVIRLSLRKNKY